MIYFHFIQRFNILCQCYAAVYRRLAACSSHSTVNARAADVELSLCSSPLAGFNHQCQGCRSGAIVLITLSRFQPSLPGLPIWSGCVLIALGRFQPSMPGLLIWAVMCLSRLAGSNHQCQGCRSERSCAYHAWPVPTINARVVDLSGHVLIALGRFQPSMLGLSIWSGCVLIALGRFQPSMPGLPIWRGCVLIALGRFQPSTSMWAVLFCWWQEIDLHRFHHRHLNNQSLQLHPSTQCHTVVDERCLHLGTLNLNIRAINKYTNDVCEIMESHNLDVMSLSNIVSTWKSLKQLDPYR